MRSCFILVFILLMGLTGGAKRFYVSPGGSDQNAGTSPGVPFATFAKGLSALVAGDTLLAMGGTYNHTATLSISKSGTADKKYYLLAMEGEKPVLVFSGTSSGKRGISLTGSHWVIRGLTITKANDNGMIISGGHYNLIENCVFYDNKDSGLQLGGGSHDNRILNCDSYWNADPPDYGDADGFAPKMDVGTNNYFFGCRAWLNCDDGWDGYLRGADNASTIVENCWTWSNGYLKNGSDPGSSANGNGFKMGGSDDKNLRHHFIVRNSLAFDNKSKGFDQNNNKGSMAVYNGTAFRNKGNGFSIPSALASGQTATVKNGLLAQGKVNLGSFVIQEANSWSGGFTVSPSDFLSMDTTGVSGPRKADGSLPELPFMRLSAGSRLIDAGVEVGLPFRGKAPDLGCFETDEGMGVVLPRTGGGTFDLKIIHAGDSYIYASYNPVTTARFTYELMTLQGSLVWKKQEQVVASARNLVTIEGSHLPSGVYLFRLSSLGRSQSAKVILP